MQCDFFLLEGGGVINLWEIPQISLCLLHDGFGFQAAVERRLVVMGCCIVLQLCSERTGEALKSR